MTLAELKFPSGEKWRKGEFDVGRNDVNLGLGEGCFLYFAG